MAELAAELAPLIPALRRYARALLHDRTAADDLVHDCLERAIARWPQRRDSQPRAWVFAILHNLAINRLRDAARRGRHVALDAADEAATRGRPPSTISCSIASCCGRWPSCPTSLGGAAGWLARGAPTPSSGIAALAQEATDSYRVYAPDRAHPVELRDPRELVRWVSDRIAHPVAIPDLTRSGYRFMGGRVVVTTHGPAGLLMYDDDRGTRMVLLIRPMAVERDTPMAPHTSGALRGYSWAAHGIGYSVVAAAAPETLHPLADEVRRQLAG